MAEEEVEGFVTAYHNLIYIVCMFACVCKLNDLHEQCLDKELYVKGIHNECLNRFGLADLLKMKEDSPLFQKLLEQFPHDDNWDEQDQVQLAYKACGLKRYSVQAVMGLKKKAKIESNETVFSSSTSTASKGKDLEPTGPLVKLEVKEYATLKVELEIVKAAEKRLGRAVSEAKSIKGSLSAAASKPESDGLAS